MNTETQGQNDGMKEAPPRTSVVKVTMLFPDGGRTDKIIDFGNYDQVKRFSRLAQHVYHLNGVVICRGMNPIPENGFAKLAQIMESKGF